MPAATLILALLAAQEPLRLEIQTPLDGVIDQNTGQVHTLILDRSYNTAPTVGDTYSFTVAQSGAYSIELRSYAFDAYLVILDQSGVVHTEDDDGLFGTHARAVCELVAGESYQVHACALHGMRGMYQLILKIGEPKALTGPDLVAAERDDFQNKILHLSKLHGARSLEVAHAYKSNGVSCYRRGIYKNLDADYQVALGIFREVQGNESVEVANTLDNLCYAKLAQGQLEEGLQVARDSWEILHKVSGENDPSTLRSLNSVAYMLRRLGRYKEAEPIFIEVL